MHNTSAPALTPEPANRHCQREDGECPRAALMALSRQAIAPVQPRLTASGGRLARGVLMGHERAGGRPMPPRAPIRVDSQHLRSVLIAAYHHRRRDCARGKRRLLPPSNDSRSTKPEVSSLALIVKKSGCAAMALRCSFHKTPVKRCSTRISRFRPFIHSFPHNIRSGAAYQAPPS